MLETYTLTYDLNGGNEAAPTKVSGIKKNTEVKLTEVKGFTRNPNEIFVGWSVTKHDAALTADAKEDEVNQSLFLPGATYRIGTKDVVLYAVWAVDVDGDKVPDYKTTYTVTYDLNGGTAVDDAEYTEEKVKPGAIVKVKAGPIRHNYTFTGWSDGMTIHQPGDIVKVLGANLLLSARWERDTGSLSVTKVVAGDAGETNRNFNFTVTLVDGAAANVSGRYGDMDFDNGVATFTLKDGEEKNATGLPADCAYTVTEAEANQDGYTTTKTGDTGTIEANETAVATFTNTKKLVGPSDPTDSKDPTKPDGLTDSKDPTKPDGLADSKSPVDALPGTGDDVVLFARLALFGALLAAIIAVAMRGKRG